jgi:hypothetical protein
MKDLHHVFAECGRHDRQRKNGRGFPLADFSFDYQDLLLKPAQKK